MPLQIRRGPTADRLTTTPLIGELVYDTQTGVVYIGDGVTAGGQPATTFTVNDARLTTARTFLGEALSDNSQHSGITFQYVSDRLIATVNESLEGHFKGSFFADDSSIMIDGETGQLRGSLLGSVVSDNGLSTLVDGANAKINLDGTVKGNIVPNANETYDIGSSSFRFRDLYLSGSSIKLGAATITASGSAVNLPAGSTVNGVPLGQAVGDLKGSVFGDDSTVLVNGPDGSINLNGTIKDNVVPGTTEQFNLGSFTTKFNKLYLTESANSLFIGNAAIGSAGSVINLPSGSTVGGNAIATSVGSNASTLTVAASSTNATFVIPFFAGTSGDQAALAELSLTYNPSTRILSAPTISGNFSGNLTGNVTGIVYGAAGSSFDGVLRSDLKGSIFGDDSTMLVDGTNSTIPFAVIGDKPVTLDGYGILDSVQTGTVTNLAFYAATGRAVSGTGVGLTYDTGTGILTVGSSSTSGLVRVFSNGAGLQSLTLSSHHDSQLDACSVQLQRSRGSGGAPSAVQTADRIYDIRYVAYDGAANQPSVVLRGDVATGVTPGLGAVPGVFRVLTANNAGSLVVALAVNSTQSVLVPNGSLIVNGDLTLAGNKISTATSNSDIELDPSGTGTVDFVVSEQTTVGAAGAASALPATPSTYFRIKVNGVSYVVPAFAVS